MLNYDYVLEDDEEEYGGVSFQGETLGEFIEDVGLTDLTFQGINNALKECGIKPIEYCKMFINRE